MSEKIVVSPEEVARIVNLSNEIRKDIKRGEVEWILKADGTAYHYGEMVRKEERMKKLLSSRLKRVKIK